MISYSSATKLGAKIRILSKFAPMIQKTQEYTYKLRMRVRDYECDIEGVVNNANYQHYLECGRNEFMRSIGVDFVQATAEDYLFMLSRIEIFYKSPLRGGDDFDVCLNIRRKGVRYLFDQVIVKASDGKVAVKAEVECIVVHEGRIAKETPYDDAMRPYFTTCE